MRLFSPFAAQAARRARQQARRALAPRVSPTLELQHIRDFRRLMRAFTDAVRAELEPAIEAAHGQRQDEGDDGGEDDEALLMADPLDPSPGPRANPHIALRIAFVASAYQTLAEQAKKASEAFRTTAFQTGQRLEAYAWREAGRTMGVMAQRAPAEDFADSFADDAVIKASGLMMDALRDTEDVLEQGAANDLAADDLTALLSDTLDAWLSRAANSARIQVLSSTADLNQANQQASGVEEFYWTTMHDSRVRDSHRAVDGQRFRYDDPPMVDDEEALPGDPPNCRCSAAPVLPSDVGDIQQEEAA